MRFRQLIFWLHLIAGVVAGIVIFIMSATGAVLAFDKEIVAWAERDVRYVTAPVAASRRDLDDLLKRLREVLPGERPSVITLDSDANTAVRVSFGRTNTFYLDPYSGAVRHQGAMGARAFMQTMIEWHRFLGGHSEHRALGKAVAGAGNTAFLFLAASGLYLWWRSHRTNSAVRVIGLINFKLRGRARDWNWHNAVGLWCAPILILITATALPLSYAWAEALIYRLTGTTPAAQGGVFSDATARVEVPAPAVGAKPLGLEAMFTAAQKEFPQWRQISFRDGSPGGRGSRDGHRPQVVVLTVVEQGQWPFFATTQVTLDPFTGAVLRLERFSDYNLGRQVRSWMRFLHTGEALGFGGKVLAAGASAGAMLLVWTGLSLAWRRFIFSGKA